MKRTLALVLAVLLALSTIALAESTELELQTIVLSKEKDNGEITLAVGEQRQIDPAFATANGWTVTGYKSSKAKAVTVDGNGLVTACAEGKAKITVKTDNKKKAKIKVKVIDPYKPDNIAIAQGKEITLAVGQSVRLDAVLSPVTAQTTLEWKSSKGKYVTVDGSGVVYAAAEGSAKITVKTHNKKKASIKVKVVDPYKPNGVSIPQGKEATLTVGQTLQLGAALSPSTAQATLVWTSNKPGVATVDGSGFVTAVGKGSAKITVKTHNGKKATFKVKVNAATATAIPFPRSSTIYFSDHGSWYEEITLNTDWTFSGSYGAHKYDYNDEIIMYAVDFSGKLSNIKKIDAYTYSMQIESISLKQEGNAYAEPSYAKGDTLILYLSGQKRIIPGSFVALDAPAEDANDQYCALYNQSNDVKKWEGSWG